MTANGIEYLVFMSRAAAEATGRSVSETRLPGIGRTFWVRAECDAVHDMMPGEPCPLGCGLVGAADLPILGDPATNPDLDPDLLRADYDEVGGL